MPTQAPAPAPVDSVKGTDEAADGDGAEGIVTSAKREPGGAAGTEASPAAPRSSAPAAGPAADDLLPPGEAALMDNHPVDSPGVRFRPGKGLEVKSVDGKFSLTSRVRVQFRNTVTYGEDLYDDHDLVNDFRIRRARIAFTGNAFGKDTRYKFEIAVSPNDSGLTDSVSESGPVNTPMLDYYFEFRQLRDLQLRIGQYKVPGNRQRVISSGDLQLVDRSLVNSEFNVDRDVGLDLRSRDFLGLDRLRYYVGVYSLLGRDAAAEADPFDLMYLARIEYLPFGQFDDYSEVDFERSRRPRLSLGAGYVYQDNAPGLRRVRSRRPADGGTVDNHIVYADAMFMVAGFSAQIEFAFRSGTRNPGGALDEAGTPIPVTAPRDGLGAMLQAGYLLPNTPFEISGRYGFIRAAETSSLSDNNELGVGFGYYPGRHPLKLQADVFQYWRDGFTGAGAETQLRVQLQASL